MLGVIFLIFVTVFLWELSPAICIVAWLLAIAWIALKAS